MINPSIKSLVKQKHFDLVFTVLWNEPKVSQILCFYNSLFCMKFFLKKTKQKLVSTVKPVLFGDKHHNIIIIILISIQEIPNCYAFPPELIRMHKMTL